MTKPDRSNPAENGQDADVNGEHKGASAYENSGPGTPGNVGGAADGQDAKAAPASSLEAEQSTVSSPAPGSGT